MGTAIKCTYPQINNYENKMLSIHHPELPGHIL